MGQFRADSQWPEGLTLFFVVIGFLLSLFVQNAALSYASVLVGGFLAGRVYYLKRYTQPILPFVLIITGFLVGYVVASFWVSRIVVVLFFCVGFFGSYYLHYKQIITIFKSKNFVK